jgi:hypothetical protein
MNTVMIKNHLYDAAKKWLNVYFQELIYRNELQILINNETLFKFVDDFLNLESGVDFTNLKSYKNILNNLNKSNNFEQIYKLHYVLDYLKTVSNSLMISGGCITSLLLNEEVNDYDMYFSSQEITDSLISFYLDKINDKNATEWVYDKNLKIIYKFKKPEYKNIDSDIFYSNINEYVETTNAVTAKNVNANENMYEPICITPNAISLTNGIQLVTRFTGEVNEILSNFDFIHTNNYYKFSSNSLHTSKEALESILTKQLHYSGSKYPICSLIRTRKFIKRGWNISAGEYLKMAFQINKLDLNNIEILKEQLIGVDAKYFIVFLEKLSKMKSLTEVNIFELLNEVFEEVGDNE